MSPDKAKSLLLMLSEAIGKNARQLQQVATEHAQDAARVHQLAEIGTEESIVAVFRTFEKNGLFDIYNIPTRTVGDA